VAASHALSQLSYSPDEVEVTGKVNACTLVVARRREAELNRVCLQLGDRLLVVL